MHFGLIALHESGFFFRCYVTTLRLHAVAQDLQAIHTSLGLLPALGCPRNFTPKYKRRKMAAQGAALQNHNNELVKCAYGFQKYISSSIQGVC